MARKTAANLATLALVLSLFPSPFPASAIAADEPTGRDAVGRGPDGTPRVTGPIDLSRPGVIRERFPQAPRWMVSGDLTGSGPDELAILFSDGSLEVQGMESGRFRRLASWTGISPDAPPVMLSHGWARESGPGLLCVDDRGRLAFYTVEGGQGRTLMSGLSSLTFPILADPGKEGKKLLLAVAADGSLKTLDEQGVEVENRDFILLPDARITLTDLNGDGKSEVVVLTRPMGKVKMARMGDDIEAQGLAVFTWTGSDLRLENEVRLEGRRFFEALSPLVGNLDRPGKPSLILPVTEEDGGSSLYAYSFVGRSLRKDSEGPKTRDARSFYQPLAVSPLGDQDRPMVLAVSGPDGQGTLEALRIDLAGTRLGTLDGIVTHLPNSRNFELALLGDLGGSGKREILAPGKDLASLRLFTFKGNSINSREIFPGTKPVSTNLCPGDYDGDGKIDVAFGLQDGTLIVLTGR